MTELLRELEAVVGLAEKATPGEWLYRQGTAIVILGQGAGGFDLSACPQPAENAQAIASSVNFLRTHHAEIAEAVRDAERWRNARDADPDNGSPYIARERQDSWGNWKTEWLGGLDADAAIDAHNSTREVGE